MFMLLVKTARESFGPTASQEQKPLTWDQDTLRSHVRMDVLGVPVLAPPLDSSTKGVTALFMDQVELRLKSH